MSRYWSDFVKTLKPYASGEQPTEGKYIKLNSNENPYAPSPNVLRAIEKNNTENLKLYPDSDGVELKCAISSYYNVEPENVFVGNGSDEVLALAFITFFKKKLPILFPDITYSFYEVYCQLFDIKFEKIALTKDFQINCSDYVRKNGGIIFPNPNAPTGQGVSSTHIEQLLQNNKNQSVIVIDEAYVDFGSESSVPLIKSFPNLLVVQTFSKSRALAGLRVGFALGSKEIIDGLGRVKNSFNSYPLDQLAIAGAVAAIKHEDYFLKSCTAIIETRKVVEKKLKEMKFYIVPSLTNFLFITHPNIAAVRFQKKLKQKGILVRHFNVPQIDQFLRISIGTKEEMDQFLQLTQEILNEGLDDDLKD